MQNPTNSQISQNPNQPKKEYQAPTLTDYGTVEQFTQENLGGPGMPDGLDFSSS